MELSSQFSPMDMPKRRPQPPTHEGFFMHPHARKQARMKGFPEQDVLSAANDPDTTYENGRYPGQMRHIKGGIVAVVDPVRGEVVTVYENVKKTALRPDQTDADAIRYGRTI